MENKKQIKICFASSSGGHLAQLKQLFDFKTKYKAFLITEKNKTTLSSQKEIKTYYLQQQERKNISILYKLMINFIKSFVILGKEKPDVIISTGAGATIPILLLGKMFGAKIIFIESFAKINSPTITGRVIYHFADQFYIQWPELQRYYPKALLKGKLY